MTDTSFIESVRAMVRRDENVYIRVPYGTDALLPVVEAARLEKRACRAYDVPRSDAAAMPVMALADGGHEYSKGGISDLYQTLDLKPNLLGDIPVEPFVLMLTGVERLSMEKMHLVADLAETHVYAGKHIPQLRSVIALHAYSPLVRQTDPQPEWLMRAFCKTLVLTI